MKMTNLQPGENVLIVGVGMGADVPFLPSGVYATGIDPGPDMLAGSPCKILHDESSLLGAV